MQIHSTTDSSTHKIAAKGNGKAPKRAKSTAASETLHLKAKQLVATPIDDVAAAIAAAAYYRAEQRGFEPGHELEDWLQAEQHVRASDR